MSNHTGYLLDPNQHPSFASLQAMSHEHQQQHPSQQPLLSHHPHPSPLLSHPQPSPLPSQPHQDLSLYASSQASTSSSSLIDQNSEHGSGSYAGSVGHQSSSSVSSTRSNQTGQGSSSSSGFICPNCSKSFARDDLLRRHIAREARALYQPVYDRQKSCYECARSKARCDLEVPSCGRCRARGKHCVYAPRSGNPNVRKARNAGIMLNTSNPIATALPSSASTCLSSSSDQLTSHSAAHWRLPSPSLYDLGGHSSDGHIAASLSFIKREGEYEYDSNSETEGVQSWQDHSYRQLRTGFSSASSSGLGSPHSQYSFTEPESVAPDISHFSISPNFSPAFIPPPPRTDSPNSYNDVPMQSSSAPFSSKATQKRSSGFSRTNTGPIVTNMDRTTDTFFNEEGEETPVVRTVGVLSQASLPSNPNIQGLLSASIRQRTTSLPQSLQNVSLQDLNTAESSPEGNQQQQQHGLGSTRLASGILMPPPRPPSLITSNLCSRFPTPSPIRPTLFTNGLDLSGWLAEPVIPSPLYRMGPSFHSLGAAFTGLGTMHPSPIVETPLGLRFAANFSQLLGGSANPASMVQVADTEPLGGGNSTPVQVGPMRTLSDPMSQTSTTTKPGETPSALMVSQLPNAKQWWLAPNQQGDSAASIAQASAAHFLSYPALLVLTDPTAPIPPFIHRKWLQENQSKVPASLAIARSILAGYYVRLAASEGMVWRLIADQIRLAVASCERICMDGSDEIEVFGAVASLWMYLVLVIFTDDQACTQHVDALLLDEALMALSELSKTLCLRITVAVSQSSNASTSGSAAAAAEKGGERSDTVKVADFTTFGWTETMIRTLFAAYSLLVLQRFRVTAESAKSQFAGCCLILDVPLPVGAAEFEAGTETEWRIQQARTRQELSKTGAPSQRITLRQLVEARSKAAASASATEAGPSNHPRRDSSHESKGCDTSATVPLQSIEDQPMEDSQQEEEPRSEIVTLDVSALTQLAWLNTCFSKYDDFTNVVLSVAFALDDECC